MKNIMKNIILTVLSLLIIIGYVLNIIKLFDTDFEESYIAENIRSLGIVVPPVGIIIGYMDIEDNKNE